MRLIKSLRPEKYLNTFDLQDEARSYLPKVIYDYLEGGADDEYCLAENSDALRKYKFLPRYLVDASKRDQSVNLFGEVYSSPFGVAPMGALSIVRKNADITLVSCASKNGIPFILSGASHASMESVSASAPGSWIQFYPCKDLDIENDLLARAWKCGARNLVVTVDVPLHSKRERSIKSGWVRPYKPNAAILWDAMKHPVWSLRYAKNGLPTMENFVPYAKPGSDAREVSNFFGSQIPGKQGVDLIERIRGKWKGHLIVKGILSDVDAAELVKLGVDGIIVSNHGGRQLDRSISAIDALPAVVRAVGDRVTVMYDSGLRRGSDIVLALCLGAKFCFAGRPFAYGLAAFGGAGVQRTIDIFRGEVDLIMAQIGACTIDSLNPHLVVSN